EGVYRWDVDTKHPEVTLKVVFRPVWYEGTPRPTHTWQAVGATDAYEPKFGMVPLVFGTLKAAFYSLMFGVPIALLAALFTSEFLHPRVKAVIKPTIELMASLPSVVLGFLAGLVFAGWVEQGLAVVLASFFTLPMAFLAGAYLWQILPPRRAAQLGSWRLAFIALALPPGLLGAWLLGPVLEGWLFGGDLKQWLNTGRGPATGGWLLLLLPACGV